jgi:hypothetical protein
LIAVVSRWIAVVSALHHRAADPSGLVREHVAWALERHAAWTDPNEAGPESQHCPGKPL